MNHKDRTCLVVGGGLAGLVAATVLHREGVQVTVLDKGRGIGGRLATRRIKDEALGVGVFDYGAQFFTVRDPRFRIWVHQWLEAGVAMQWSRGFPTEDGTLRGVGEPRYRGAGGIRGIAKHLAAELDIRTSTRVIEISWDRDEWSVRTEADDLFRGSFLVLTPPVPQSLELIHASGLMLPAAVEDRLHSVAYEPCLAVLALLRGPTQIPEPGGMWLSGEPIAWMADNQQKGISPGAVGVTIHAGLDFSQAHWQADDTAVAGQLLAAAAPWLGSEVVQYQVHRWRYSKPSTFHGEPCLRLNDPGPWILAGDALGGPRIEGAFLSGLSAADATLAWCGL
jgi:predicted NAD/FAD-dependent oxidoreductase